MSNTNTLDAKPRKRHVPSAKSALVTLQAASVEYGPPVSSLRDLVLRGELEKVTLGVSRRIFIRRADLEQLIGVGR